ncbi:MAG: response regulator [Cucumibacter sp.]
MLSGARQILLIEDSDTQALLYAELLSGEAMAVHRVASAEAGLDYLRANRPDLIVVDYHLPGMQGDDFCRLIREGSTTAAIPLLILTDDNETHTEQRGLEFGADDYVAKSADTDILLARIELLLRRSSERPLSSVQERAFYRAQQVLVVDDSPTYLTFLEEELKHEGYRILAAPSGEAAIEIVRKGQVDCAVIDLVMPGMDGIQLCREIGKWRDPSLQSLPILIVTSRGSKEKMMEALECGADDYVEKSSESTVLKARIRALLRRKMLHDEHRKVQDELRLKELEIVRERAEKKAAEARAELAERLKSANDELYAANRELKEAQTQLVQSAKMASLGSLVAGIAHEVNNPLAFSMSHLGTIGTALAALAAELGGKLTEAGAARLDKANRRIADVSGGLNRVQDLMTKLRTFSRLDEGTFKQADIGECVESALPLIQHRLNGGITLVTRFAADNSLYCAPGLLNQVVLNLLTNAIDAVGTEGRIEVATGWDGADFCLIVGDSGPGVPEELRERVFEPFFTTKQVGKGTGLGLAIGYKIVERHRGRIEIGRSPLGGAEFTIRIPADLREKTNAA